MEGQRANYPFWCDWFPVQERILNHEGLGPKKPLLVDIGGGRGHDLIHFREQFPDASGMLILEELPSVLDEVRAARDMDIVGVETVGHDFFAEKQPVHSARAYYFKHVLHDWSDEKATIILNNLKPAMKCEYSKILIEEFIIPDRNAALPCMTDIAVMVFCSGLQRTRQQWTNLLQSVGLKILNFWGREGEGLGVIEADLPEENLTNGYH